MQSHVRIILLCMGGVGGDLGMDCQWLAGLVSRICL